MYDPRHYESTVQQGFRYRVLLATKSRRNHRQRASGQRGKVGDDAPAIAVPLSELDTSCSIFTAEAVAIYRALPVIDSTMPRKYCIYTDAT
ncbi:hypothetical protein TNCV_501481 [Trichonephila clavipes]|nr:hypothetical protein TNCV_501481 [Trichonephila clavipes]